jgi:hypothetical protein
MTKTTKPPGTAPKHLRKESAAFFNNVMTDYTLDEHHVILLTKACESLDRIEEAREIIKREGLTYKDRFGSPRANPAVAIERDNCGTWYVNAICWIAGRETQIDREGGHQRVS